MDGVAAMWRQGFRGLRLFDLPALVARQRFLALRRRYHRDLWARVARRLGAALTQFEDFTRIEKDGVAVLSRGGELRLDDPLTLDMMGDKALTFRLLAEQGVATPRHVTFHLLRLRPALALMARAGTIVVKPARGTAGGAGVTTGIAGLAGLLRAAWTASLHDPHLIAEEEIAGASYRLLYLDGELIDAVRRDPPCLTGDGRRTVRQLVAAENRRRLKADPFRALSPLRLDGDARARLGSQGLKPSSRPAGGRAFVVKSAINQNGRADNHVVTAEVHPATAALCGRLAANLGVRLAGIDILARDIALPLTRDNGVIGEINTTPGLHHHDLVAVRTDGRIIAAEIVRRLMEQHSAAIVLPERAPTVVELKRRAS